MDDAAFVVDYGAGKLLDVYVPATSERSALLILWHGRGPHERNVLGPLARRIASTGIRVVVPDWSSEDGANGKGDLAQSISYVRNELAEFTAVDRIALAGWSLGASAGLDIVLHPEAVGGWRPDRFVGISGGYEGSPFSPAQPSAPCVDAAMPLLLLHGSKDEIVPVERSRVTFERLRKEGWSVSLREVSADHAGIIGTQYDPLSGRCVPTSDALRLEVLVNIATMTAEFVLGD